MKVEVNMGEGYTPAWNLMHEAYFPCKSEIYALGMAYEDAKEAFENFADNEHDHQDMLSADLYTWHLSLMDAAEKKLKPYKDHWWRARHGYGLN